MLLALFCFLLWESDAPGVVWIRNGDSVARYIQVWVYDADAGCTNTAGKYSFNGWTLAAGASNSISRATATKIAWKNNISQWSPCIDIGGNTCFTAFYPTMSITAGCGGMAYWACWNIVGNYALGEDVSIIVFPTGTVSYMYDRQILAKGAMWSGCITNDAPFQIAINRGPVGGSSGSYTNSLVDAEQRDASGGLGTNSVVNPSPWDTNYTNQANSDPAGTNVSLGDKTIIEALKQLNETAAKEGTLQGLTNLIGAIGGVGGGTTVVTNNLSVGITNVVSVTNDFGPLSNQLATVSQAYTNDQAWGNTMRDIGKQANITTGMMQGTNAESATAAAQGVLSEGGTETGLQGIANAVGTAPSGESGGDGSVFEIPFPSASGFINVDPAVVMPGVPEAVRLVTTWLAILAVLLFMGEQYWKALHLYAASEGGGVPNLESDIPFIGNAAGFLLALVVPAAYLLIWISFWSFVLGAGWVEWLTSVHVNPVSHIATASPGAAYLINQFVNVELLLQLAWARLSWYYVGGKAAHLAISGSRFLFTK